MTLYRSRRHEAHAVHSNNLAWSGHRIQDIDVLTARGMSGSSLGADLERLKYGFDRSAYQPCVDQLSAKFQHRTRRRASVSLIHAALHEFLDDRCTSCGGRAAVQTNVDEFACCDICNGTGQRRYTDAERAHACSVKVSTWPHHERDYLEVLDSIHRAVGKHQVGMTRALAEPA
jgi:hypothetical protein